jgi:hypothetical protein
MARPYVWPCSSVRSLSLAAVCGSCAVRPKNARIAAPTTNHHSLALFCSWPFVASSTLSTVPLPPVEKKRVSFSFSRRCTCAVNVLSPNDDLSRRPRTVRLDLTPPEGQRPVRPQGPPRARAKNVAVARHRSCEPPHQRRLASGLPGTQLVAGRRRGARSACPPSASQLPFTTKYWCVERGAPRRGAVRTDDRTRFQGPRRWSLSRARSLNPNRRRGGATSPRRISSSCFCAVLVATACCGVAAKISRATHP